MSELAPVARDLEVARRALEEADALPKVTQLIDMAEVARLAARKAGLAYDAQQDWAVYKLDAERKAGEMLKKMERQGTGRPKKHKATVSLGDDTISSPTRLSDLGISRPQSSAWQRIASLPDETYAAYKADTRDKGKEITEAGALRIAKHREREDQKRRTAATVAEVIPERPEVTHASWADWIPEQPVCDLLLTDPPYSTDLDDVAQFANEWLPVALDKVKPSGRAYVCIGAYPAELAAYLAVVPPAHLTLANVLVWTYRNTLGPKPTYDYKLNWQAILYYRGAEAPPLNCSEMVEQFSVQDLNAPDGRRGDRWHAWQKPDVLADRLVTHSTRPGDLVLDPFAGTGTFLLSAARLGRRGQGCEVDQEALAIAIERGCIRAR